MTVDCRRLSSEQAVPNGLSNSRQARMLAKQRLAIAILVSLLGRRAR